MNCMVRIFRFERRQHILGFRPLQRDQRALGERLDPASIGKLRCQVRFICHLARRVDHE